MHQKPWKYAHSSSFDANQLKVLLKTHWKQNNPRKTQRRLNWMSQSSSHSVGWIDTLFSTFVGWVLWLEFSKETVRSTDEPSIGSSGDLGFGNSKVQSSASSILDDPMLWLAVHLTPPTFKSYRDTTRFLVQHRMNRRFIHTSTVHPTALFELHSTAPSGCSSASDRPTVCRCIASVHWLGHLVQRLYQRLWVTGWSDAFAGDTISSSDGTTFQGNFSNG
jgi:hypothetical protein